MLHIFLRSRKKERIYLKSFVSQMNKSLEMSGLCAVKSLPQHPAGYKKQTSSNYSPAGKINKCFSCLSDQDCSMILATCETMGYPFNLIWKYVMFINSVIFSVIAKLFGILL